MPPLRLMTCPTRSKSETYHPTVFSVHPVQNLKKLPDGRDPRAFGARDFGPRTATWPIKHACAGMLIAPEGQCCRLRSAVVSWRSFASTSASLRRSSEHSALLGKRCPPIILRVVPEPGA
jgi:hypothetical protein